MLAVVTYRLYNTPFKVAYPNYRMSSTSLNIV